MMNENNLSRINECGAFLSCSDYAEDDGRIYFANTNYNALAVIDKKSRCVETLIPFQGMKRSQRDLHLKCVKRQNKVCFLPARSGCVHIYNTENNSIQACGIGEEADTAQGNWDYFSCGEQVYLLPAKGAQGLWIWAVERDSVERLDWWKMPAEDVSLIHGQVDENSFYTLGVGTDKLTISDVLNRKADHISLPDEHVLDITYDFDEGNFWYTLSESPDIVCWNRNEGIVDRYEIPYNDLFPYGKITYLKIFYGFGKLFLISSDGGSLYLLDRENRVLENIYAIDCTRGYFFPHEIEPTIKILGDRLVCLLKNAGDVILIDRETMNIEQHKMDFILNEEADELAFRVLLDRSALLYEENGTADLSMLLSYCAEEQAQSER